MVVPSVLRRTWLTFSAAEVAATAQTAAAVATGCYAAHHKQRLQNKISNEKIIDESIMMTEIIKPP